MPSNVTIPPPPPLTEFQKHALAVYYKKKRVYYEKKDQIISRKYKWLEDLNQRDPDLEGIEISEASLELLKKKRQDLIEEKHTLFEKLKSVLPPTEDEELENPAFQQGPQGYHTPVYQAPVQPYSPYPSYSSTPYTVVTEPITPKKPSEMSPVQSDRKITKPSDMSPVHYSRGWDNISPVHKSEDTYIAAKFQESRDFSTTAAVTKYAETRENRIDSFTKAFTDTISKAMMSELNMTLESAAGQSAKSGTTPETKADIEADSGKLKSELKEALQLLSPKHKSREWSDRKSDGLPGSKTPDAIRRPEPKTPDFSRRSEPKTPDLSRRADAKGQDGRRSEQTSGKSRKSVSGTESNSSISSKHHSQSPHTKLKEEVSDLPPVIKISKAEIHSKVMSWPTSHPYQRKALSTPEADKKATSKKESADSSGSSLLEFAFQSALFGNTLFNEASPAQNQGAAAQPPPPQTPTSQAPSDLLAALSMSYGSKKTSAAEGKHEDRKGDQDKCRKRERSPENRSPSPELVTVYKTVEKSSEETKDESGGEKKTTPPPPPPPPPPPKSSSKKLTSPVTNSAMGYTPCSPGAAPYNSFHSPVSFLSPTHTSQYSSPMPQHSPIRSPMMNPYSSPGAAYHPPPHSPRIGMLPPPMPHQPLPHQAMPHQPLPHQAMPHQPLPHQAMPHQPLPHQAMPHQPLPHQAMRQPLPGMPPHMPLPPQHMHHGHKYKNYPNNRYL